jgi:hypothetical protein
MMTRRVVDLTDRLSLVMSTSFSEARLKVCQKLEKRSLKIF